MNSKSQFMKIAVSLYEKGMTLRQAAGHVGVSVSGLWKYMVKNGIARRAQGSPRKVPGFLREEILREHLEKGIGISALARRYNLSKETIRKIFREEGKMIYTASQVKKVAARRRDEELRPRIIDLYRKGFPVKEIAKTVRTSQRRVSRVVRQFIQSLGPEVLSSKQTRF